MKRPILTIALLLLATGLIVAAGRSYRLQATAAELDLLAFGQLTARARGGRAAGQQEASCAAYEAALGLWRGEPLADIDSLRENPAVIAIQLVSAPPPPCANAGIAKHSADIAIKIRLR